MFTKKLAAALGSLLTGFLVVSTQAASPGDVLWQFTASPRVEIDPHTGLPQNYVPYIFSSPAVAVDGTIYFGAANKVFYALNPNGTEKWNYLSGGEIQSSPAIGADGIIYFGSIDGKVYALNPDGTKAWDYATERDVFSSPALAVDGTIYIGSRDKYVYAINPDGTLKWRYLTGGQVDSTPVVGDDGTIYIGSDDYILYALNPSGTLRWSYRYGNGWVGGMGASIALGTNGVAYVAIAGSGNRLVALQATNGAPIWTNLFGSLQAYVAPVAPIIDTDGTLYLGSPDKKFYAINPNGTKKWELFTGSAGHSTAALGEDGNIYFNTWDMQVFSIWHDQTNAFTNWTYTASGAAVGGLVTAIPTLTSDGILYIGTGTGKFYALQASSGFAMSAWPMFGRNTKHTGNSGSMLLAPAAVRGISRQNGQTVLDLWSERGVPLKLETSTDLVNWSSARDFTNNGSNSQWIDNDTSHSTRFYRVSNSKSGPGGK